MSVFEGYTLKNRPEITLTKEELWEVERYCEGLHGLNSLTFWLENEAPCQEPDDPKTKALVKYAKEHQEDVAFGYNIWEDYLDTCTYDMGYEEMCSVVRCIESELGYDI